MENEIILRKFMQSVWNEKDFNSIAEFVNPQYTIHIVTGDPWEGKTLNNEEFEVRLNYSFNSFPDIHFEIQNAISDCNYVAITWIMTVAVCQLFLHPVHIYLIPQFDAGNPAI